MPLPCRSPALLTGALVAAALAATPAAARKPEKPLSKTVAVAVTARPVPFERAKPQQTRFGQLIWLGTLELSSQTPHFGGYSGLALDAAGKRLVAVSDAGHWLTGEIVYRDGRAAGLAKAKIGPLRALDGRPLRKTRDTDAEGIAFAEAGAVSGNAYVAFERNHRIGLFSVGAQGVGPPSRYLKLPAQARSATSNKGFEALAVLRAGPAKGGLLAFTEEYLDEAGNQYGWILGGATPGRVRLRQEGGFAVTDLAALPNGDLLVLERRFRSSEGVKMRLRRVPADAVRPGALLDGEILLESDDTREIDNMEGLAVHRDAGGRTILTVISDDNFNRWFQRTLLMQFALP